MEIKAAIIDLYNNEYNEGMRCIKEIVSDAGISFNVFDSRYKNEVPGLEYDIYISSGGPGSPFEGTGSEWENKYFQLLDKVYDNNQKSDRKKYFFFICHSFQIMARHFKFAEVTERYRKSFGIIPFVKTSEGLTDPLLSSLPQPFYAADFRQFQVVNANDKVINDLGATILSKEIVSNGQEPALMAVRISNEIAGTQFHPEADPESMAYHFRQQERKDFIINNFGEDKYKEMISIIDQPDAIKLTRKTVLPSFLNNAINKLNRL